MVVGGGWVYRANANTALVQMEQSLQELVNKYHIIFYLVEVLVLKQVTVKWSSRRVFSMTKTHRKSVCISLFYKNSLNRLKQAKHVFLK